MQRGKKPVGNWLLKLPNDPTVKSWFKDGKIEDILFVITFSGTTPPWGRGIEHREIVNDIGPRVLSVHVCSLPPFAQRCHNLMAVKAMRTIKGP